MSTPTQAFSNLTEVKRFLNITPSDSNSNTKIATFQNVADNYVDTQINLHDLIPLATVPPSLVSLASTLAAAYFNYWQAPVKGDLLKDVKQWEKEVLDFILATFAKKNPNGLAGGKVFGKTASMTGNTTGPGSTI